MLTKERLQELFIYDEETGVFHWAKTRGGAHQGKIAGEQHRSARSNTSYIRIEIEGERYFAHNLVWLWHTGNLPQAKLDHKDRNGLNNCFSNLREASASQNKFNTDLYKNNTSGYSGITRSGDKWKAEISHEGKKLYLGVFSRVEWAIAARQRKARELYGDFA